MTTWVEYMDRFAPGESPRAVAAKLEIDPSQVSRWRTGKSTPSAQSAIRFAEAYGGDHIEALTAAGRLTKENSAALRTVTEGSAQEIGGWRAGIRATWNHIKRLAHTVADESPPVSRDLREDSLTVVWVVADILIEEILGSPQADRAKDLLDMIYEEKFELRRLLRPGWKGPEPVENSISLSRVTSNGVETATTVPSDVDDLTSNELPKQEYFDRVAARQESDPKEDHPE